MTDSRVMKLLVVVCLLFTTTTETLKCTGRINISIVEENAAVYRIQIDGIDSPTAYPVGTPPLTKLPHPTIEDYAGQNYLTIDEHHIQLFPLGKLGVSRLYVFDLKSTTWGTIDVYCPPLGVAYIRSSDQISGFCAVNTTYGGIACVPYFKLTRDLPDGKWTDSSEPGYCSEALSTTDLTNPVILQNYDSNYEADIVKLYFAERGTNRLYEVNLAEYGETVVYPLPRYTEDHSLEITHLVPAIANDESFFGLQVESVITNSSGFYQTLASASGQGLEFASKPIKTASVAFNSYNLDYLVTFANNKTLVIVRQEATAKQYQLSATLNEPIQCQNMPVGLSIHHMICLANGRGVLLIHISSNGVTSKIIYSGSSSIVSMEWLTDKTFYLLDNQHKMMFFMLNSDLLRLGEYTVGSANIRVVNSSGEIMCSTVTPADDHITTIIASVIGTTVPFSFGILILILLWCWWKRKKSRFGTYSVMYRNSEDTVVTTSSSDIELVDEEHLVIAELPDNQGDHPISLETSNNGHNEICLPSVNGSHGITDQNSLAPTPPTFNLTMGNPRQCTNDDPEPSLPSEYRLPPVGSH